MKRKLIILAIYINVDGLTRQQAEQQIYQLMKEYQPDFLPDDIKENYHVEHMWLPIKSPAVSKIELIYPPIFQQNIDKDGIDKMIEGLQKLKGSLDE
jgi:hypothetical protein